MKPLFPGRLAGITRASTTLKSLLLAAIFFAAYLALLRPGYGVNDDLVMISLVSGYLGSPTPFMVFSNVLLGLILIPLYQLKTNLNWETLLFILVNLVSVWCLLYIVISTPIRGKYRALGALAVLSSDSYFLINLSFTTIAAFAAIAGFSTIFMAAARHSPRRRVLFVPGVALILVSSLIRMDSLLLVLLTLLPTLALSYRFFETRPLAVALLATAGLVFVGYWFDSAYVRADPQWSRYYEYNQARALIQDTPRVHIENIASSLPAVGWHRIDYRMFGNWFFPDEHTFSDSNLRYLIDHVSDKDASFPASFLASFSPSYTLSDLYEQNSLPYLLLLVAVWLVALCNRSFAQAVWPLAALLASFLVLLALLSWTQKVPLYVWYSFLATMTLVGLCLLILAAAPFSPTPDAGVGGRLRLVRSLPGVLILASACLSVIQAAGTSAQHRTAERRYTQVLSELQALEAQGEIQPNSLIISPMRGIPLEWSDPFLLNLPNVKYFQIEWLTFSPAYYQILQEYGVRSLPSGLYTTDNVYLMTRKDLIHGIVDFIQLHESVRVRPQWLYSMNRSGVDEGFFTDVELYKLVKQP